MNPYRDDALYRELIHLRPTPPAVDACSNGPSLLLMQLERERDLWLWSQEQDEELTA